MMCKCCKGGNGACNCIHHKVEKMVLGLVLLVLAVLLYMHNYAMFGPKLLCGPSVDMWSWSIPLVVGLIGLKMLVMGCMHMMYAKKHAKECKDGKCDTDMHGDDKCCSDKDGMSDDKCCKDTDETKKE